MGVTRKLLAGVVLLTLGVTSLALWADEADDLDGKRVKVLLTRDQREVQGTLEVTPDGYRITTDKGIKLTLLKSQVYKILPLDDAPAGGPEAKPGERRKLSEAEIEQVLGSENIELGPTDVDEQVDLRADLPVNQQSVQEMLRIAGPKAKTMEFPHYVFVYTSRPELARQLGARLESVYEWCVRFMEMLDLPRTQMPDHKLEVFFFGEYDEFLNYGRLLGMGAQPGLLGFYRRDLNRSAFFDMSKFPPYVPYLEQVNDPSVDSKRRQEIAGKMKRIIEHQNLEVVQHEAAHHIHFNIGIFPKGGDFPRWQTEGLATMFEVPPSEVGASFGSINHTRLSQIRQFYGPRGEGLPPMRDFILNDGLFFQMGGAAYPIGWAINYHLLQNKRDAFRQWMLLMGQREDDWQTQVTVAERSEQFEELFGTINDDWVKAFNDFIASVQLRPSIVPPDFPP